MLHALLFCVVLGGTGVELAPLFDAAGAAATQLLTMLECKDENDGCQSWATGGECSKNPGFMQSTCRKACGRCQLSGDDAQNALEIAAYATRTLHAGCSGANKPPTPACAGSAERLAALLAISQSSSRGASLQRYFEVLAHEVLADAAMAAKATGSIELVALTTDTRVASVGSAGRSPSPFTTLSDGGRMPTVGLGTWLTTGQACYDLVSAGLRAGLRHIDTSENYANHEEIGRALADAAVPRDELFIADKLSFSESYSSAGVRSAVAASLSKLGIEYLDLYMLHSVGPSEGARHEAWREMVALQSEGKIRHLGVSNFGVAELRRLKDAFPDAPPVTLQSKFNPYHRGRTGNAGGDDFLLSSAELGVVISAYCPLNDWPSKLKAVDDKLVAMIGARRGKTAAQVLLRWGVQLGVAPLTRSSHEVRLRQATQIWDFALSEEEMALISGLAWMVLAPNNRVPSTVVDAFGVQARDAEARQHVPRDQPPEAQPIKACDMAWEMLGGRPSKVEL
jgi:2,5-diketo-D-gluconate reductase A